MESPANREKQPPVPQIGRGGGPGRHLGQFARAKDARSTAFRLGGYLWQQKWAMLAVVVMVMLATGLNLAGPYLLGVAIDSYIIPRKLGSLGGIALLMVGVYAFQAVAEWVYSVMMIHVSQRIVQTLRRDLFDRLQLLSLRFFDRRPHGEMMSRLTNDVENVSMFLAENVTTFISSLLTVIGTVIMMLALHVGMALVSLTVLPLMVMLTQWIVKHTRRDFRAQQAALGQLNSIIEETTAGGKTVHAFNREDAVIAEFEATNEELRRAAISAQTFAGFLGPSNNVIFNLGYVIIASAGGWMAVEGMLTVGAIATFLTYSQQLRRPLTEVTDMFNTIQAALAGAERIFEVLDEVPELPDAPDAKPVTGLAGDVVFDAVSFGYVPDVPVLKNVSLHAAPGQTIALVGPTGAGKTTIINLLSRFYDIDAGSIQVDGHDIRDLKKADLRRALGIVLQDTFLFAESVKENIRYGRLDASDEDVIAAARMANADHFIRRLPNGYDTILAERAANLSQGQRQLIAIARAILANPLILILDEATSSVDTRTEVQVQDAMRLLMQGRTSFVIAHRLSTIREADQILVIRDGEIVERGTHHDLLARRGFYHHLYQSQFRGTELTASA